MTLTTRLQHYNEITSSKIKALLDQKFQLSGPMLYSLLGSGKRIRPFLFLETASIFGVNEDSIIDIAAAIEFIQTYSLIHDDLPAMDNANYRRGQPSCHKQFDEATAILAGDALLTEAFGIIAENNHISFEKRCSLIRELSNAIGYKGMIHGQMLDIEAEELNFDLEQVEQLQQYKTGKLLSFCCKAAALIGDANTEQMHALQLYTEKLGILYQIVDDILDWEGDEAITGKDLKKDVIAGKATFVSILGLEKSKIIAEQFARLAIDSIKVFGGKTKYLVELVSFVRDRKN